MAKPSDKFLRAHHKAWDLTDKLRVAESTAVKGATREAYDKSFTEKAGKVAELRAASVKAHRTAGDVAAREGDHDRAMTHGTLSHSLAKTFNPETPTSAAVASHRLPDRPVARALKASNLEGKPTVKKGDTGKIQEGAQKSAPAAPKSKQEQHAERLKTFAASGKAAAGSKRAGELLASKQPLQTSARGAKFYISRAGEKVYVK